MNEQQDWMDQLGVNTPALENIIMGLNTEPKILGAKISGSGLGDCVVALGTVSEKNPWRLGTQWIPVNITEEGARLEKI
jgi:mevalonate kinase